MTGRALLCLACVATAASCAGARPEVPAPSAEAASAAVARLVASQPETFKMVHQVVARFAGQTYPMNGYLLGRHDGSFRVSAMLAVGPKLFDVSKVSGRWESKIYIEEVAAHVDPLEVGRAVDRIYFRWADGPLVFEKGAWVSRQSMQEEDVDMVEVWRSPADLSVLRKRFLRKGRPVLEVTYDKPETIRGQTIARFVRLTDARGFTLELSVTDYQPGFPVPEARLRLGD